MKKFLLKKKIALLLTVISTVSLFVVGYVVYLTVSGALVDNKKTEIVSNTVEQTHENILTFKNNQLFVYMLGTRTRVKEFLLDRSESRRVELSNIFLEYTNKDKKYLAIYLLDKNGIGLISTDPRFIGQDYSFRSYFKKAIKGESAMDVAIGKTSNQLGYYFSEPVFGNNNDILGVMVVKVDESNINNPIILNSEVKNNVMMLVDEFGVVLFSTEKGRNYESLGKLTDQEKATLKMNERFLNLEISPLQYDIVEQGIRDYKNPAVFNFKDIEDKDNEMLSLTKLGDLPFYLVTEVRLSALNNQIFNTVYTIILIILIILIFISLIIYYSLTIFIKPLDKFKLIFTNIGKGDFLDKLEIKTGDEFEDIAKVINEMTDKLRQSYSILESEIKKRTLELENEKDSLDIKVKERTKELESFKNNLEKTIEERTQKLNDKLIELEMMNKLMVGRELDMVKLKDEIKELRDNLAKNI